MSEITTNGASDRKKEKEKEKEKVIVSEKFNNGMTISLIETPKPELNVYWEESDFILDELPKNGERIKINDICSTVLIKELQLEFNYNLPEKRLKETKVVDIHKMLSKFNIVNNGNECTYQEGNGAYIYGGYSNIIIHDQEKDQLYTISVISIDIETEYCYMEVKRHDIDYKTTYKKTFDKDIRTKNEYKWIDVDGTRKFVLQTILVDQNDVEVSNKEKKKLRNLQKRYYKRSLGSWFAATGLSDTDEDEE